MSEPTPLLAPQRPPSVAARLWTGTAFVSDTWRRLTDDEAVPLAGYAFVSLARWPSQRAALMALDGPIGIRVDPSEAVERDGDEIDRLGAIALVFPKFTDGRAYSAARRLRQWTYKGQIRATGDVLLDQIPLMLRSGFDAFEIVHAPTIDALEQGRLPAVTRIYQGQAAADAGTTLSVWQPRRGQPRRALAAE